MICVRGKCAPPSRGQRLEQRLIDLIRDHGMDDAAHDHYTRCTITNCLAVCEDGPVMIVHPEGIRYGRVDEAALEHIFHEHLLNDRPVTALMVQPSSGLSIKPGKSARKRQKFR